MSDAVLAMDLSSLTRFLDDKLDLLKSKESTYGPLLFVMERDGGSVADAVGVLLSDGQTPGRIKADVALSFALGDDEIHLDYWGCFSEVFGDYPEGSISAVDYLPETEEAIFILLRPEHGARMVGSLREPSDDLSIMGDEDVERLAGWRDFCAANLDFVVAYWLDF